MHSKWLGRIGFAALVAAIAGSSGAGLGCAAERDPINRVQLNALPKSFFLGQKYDDPVDDPEFYARSMVIDVPYGESGSDFLMFTNTINSVSKIKWQITEDKLIGRVSFERVVGTDGKGPTPVEALAKDRDPSKPVAQNEGLVVYQFPIQSQFDIRRDYNPQTGEESNVVVENSTDRPWNQRDYVRVDFSSNQVTTAYDFDTLSLLGVYNGIEWSPLNYDIRDPNDKNAPVLDIENGYFDVTNKAFASPQLLDLGGWKIPGCMLPNLVRGGTAPVGNCNPNEITIRHSFKRVTDTDYEPVDWDGQKFETYGAFTAERYGYARDYGLADKQWYRFIQRYNIWERHHYYADSAKMEGAKACKVDADCAGVGAVSGMSHCDTFNDKCTLPYRDRKAKPIIWYYSDGSPGLYFDATREAAEEWDAAMRSAVVAAKYAECKRFPTEDAACGNPVTGNWAEEENVIFLVKEINACRRGEVPGYEQNPKGCNDLAQEIGGKRGYADATIAIAQMEPMVTLCHSPVSDKDPTSCGKVGTVARLGDLRFHLVTNVGKVETNSPWGIMSDANDPTTGEKIAASINVWTHVNDLAARGLVDTLRYIGEELKTSDITDGTYVNQWVEAARTMGNNGGTVVAPIMDKDELDKRVAAAAGTTIDNLRAAERARVGSKWGTNTKGARLRQALVNNLERVAQTKAAWDAPSVTAPLYQARMNMLKGTTVEAALVTPAMQQLARSSYGTLDQNAITHATSIFQGLAPQLRRAYEHRLENALAARGACVMPFEATAPLAFVSFADALQQKFGRFNPNDPQDVQLARADKMKDYLRRRLQYAVIAHEMGHSFALRHNFVSSSDAWNFRPQYWQLRTNDKKLSEAKTPPCDPNGSSDGKSCVGPRWLDPVTPNETKNLIHMWAQSSTMEYPGEIVQDLLGLGRYDFGAARMFYGLTTAVYADSRFLNNKGPGSIAEAHQNEFGGLLGYRYGSFSNPIHYSRLDQEADLIEKDSCKSVAIEDFRPASWNEEKDGAWHPVIDGRVVSNEQGVYTRCKEPSVDFVQWDALKDGDDKTHAHDKSGRVRVPHGFASDEWADLGNIAVFRHDNGADLYETMHFWIAQQEINHIFTNYRRGRRDFSVWGAFSRTLSRYHEKMRDSAKAIALYSTLARDTVALYNDGDDPQGFVAEVLKQVATDNVAASSIAFDHFAHVFARPQPGEHGRLGSDDAVLRSHDGTGFANPGTVILQIPNGVMGTNNGFGAISLGGRPVENALARNMGRDYDRDYTLNVGDYYEKAFTAMLFTESADNFISASRDDFVDPRFRAVSLADVFPDGFRRWLGNNLTGDDAIKGVYVRGAGSGTGTNPPEVDANGFASLGGTSWWPADGIQTCFPQGERLACRDPFSTSPVPPGGGVGPVVDPQVGWEQQKFALILSLVFIPENGRQSWLDQMRIWQLGADSDPGIPQDERIEFHDPTGKVWVARTFGTETLRGKVVQKGIAARMLQYANEILAKAAVTTPVNGKTATWYLPVRDTSGNWQFKQPDGKIVSSCDNSRDCTKLKNYTSLPKLMREAEHMLGFFNGVGGLRGVY